MIKPSILLLIALVVILAGCSAKEYPAIDYEKQNQSQISTSSSSQDSQPDNAAGNDAGDLFTEENVAPPELP